MHPMTAPPRPAGHAGAAISGPPPGGHRPGRGARRGRPPPWPPCWHLPGTWGRSGCSPGSLRPGGPPLVLVARSTVAAAAGPSPRSRRLPPRACPSWCWRWWATGCPTAEARYRFRVLEGRVGAVVRMPFVPAFRAADDPCQVRLPSRARQALAEIRALAREQAPPRRRQPDPKGDPDDSDPSSRPGGARRRVGHPRAARRGASVAGGVPNPAPAAPPGLAGTMNTSSAGASGPC